MEKRAGYGQFCPISRAAEVLTERWNPLVIRELYCGSVRFNDLQRGVPRMSSSLLARRLRELEHAGIVERRPATQGRGFEYHLTDAGKALFPVIKSMGNWAQQWARSDLLADENLDPGLLMWDIRRGVKPGDMPEGNRFLVQFEFDGVPPSKRRYWLLFDRNEADLCIRPPGFDVDLYVYSPVRAMVEVWLGHRSLDDALKTGDLRFEGSGENVKRFRAWFALSMFAPAAPQAAGGATVGAGGG